MKKYQPLTKDFLCSVLSLDSDTGSVYWINPSKYHSEKYGMEAGCARSTHSGKRYWRVKINGKAYLRSYIVYCIVYGTWPKECLDHINGNSLDDRPINLREATVTQNAWNHKKRKRRIDLPMGVRVLASGLYQARIGHNKHQHHLGSYKTPEEASRVYQKKRKELFGEFA